MNNQEKTKLVELIVKANDGQITDQQRQSLNEMINNNRDAMVWYLEIVDMLSCFSKYGTTDITNFGLDTKEGTDEDILSYDLKDNLDLWRALAEEENNAVPVAIEKPVPKQVVQNQHQDKRKISRFSIYALTLSAAAAILLMVMVLLTPQPPIVARLSDSIDAEWITKGEYPIIGDVLRREVPMTLADGLAEITFDDGAVVVVEAPAMIELFGPNKMFLKSGKLSAKVSEYATGFTVDTPSASIVDLGTEFGISVIGDGSCSVNMFKGKANLVAGVEKQQKTTQIVNVNEAMTVDISTGQMRIKTFEKDSFARHIDSESGLIWRGRGIDLADIVGNGNGFGSGLKGSSINLGTGELYVRTDSTEQYTDNKYHPCVELPFVNGVFAPDGGESLVQVTSQGHLWKDCPDTTGIFHEGIYTDSRTRVSVIHSFVLNGQRYGTVEHPAIVTHCNAGVTFDIAAIRPTLSDLKITRFEALCGVSQEAGNEYPGNVSDFFVLVDGEKRFEAKGIGVLSEPVEISFELSQEDRFLTLISTDGDMEANHDWSFYAEPRLVLE